MEEAVVFSLSVLIMLSIPCYVIYTTRRQTKLKIFNILTLSRPNNIFWNLIYPFISTVLLLLYQTLTLAYDERRPFTYSNSTSKLDIDMLYVHSNSAALTLFAILNLIVNSGLKCVYLMGSVLSFWMVDIIFTKDSWNQRGQDVTKVLISLTGIAMCVLYFVTTIEKTMCKMRQETVICQNENSYIVDIEKRFKQLTSIVLPLGLPRDWKADNSQPQNSIMTANSNIGIMVVSCPKLREQLNSENDTHSMCLLNDMISGFDQLLLSEKFSGLTKIEGCHSSYIVVSGLEHLKLLVTLALTMHMTRKDIHQFGLRIGLHYGPAITGSIGNDRRHFDVWGEAAEIARFINLSCKEGDIMISNTCKKILENAGYSFKRDEQITELKDTGNLTLYILNQPQS